MAYSNWGAKVWCDGEARHQNCDVTPQMVLDGTVYIHYLLHYTQVDKSRTNEMFHAVVGDGESGVLVCLYKSFPSSTMYLLNDGKLEAHNWEPSDDFDWWDEEAATVELPNGITVELEANHYPESVRCNFTDINGRKWTAISGYGLGEGYEEWD